MFDERFTSEISRRGPTVRETSNPILRNLPKQEGGYAQFGTGVAGATRMGYQADPYVSSPRRPAYRGR